MGPWKNDYMTYILYLRMQLNHSEVIYILCMPDSFLSRLPEILQLNNLLNSFMCLNKKIMDILLINVLCN